jgi:hypothetical protein
MGNGVIPAPTQKTFEAEGEILEHALTKSFRIRNGRSRVCVLRYADLETLPSKQHLALSLTAVLDVLGGRTVHGKNERPNLHQLNEAAARSTRAANACSEVVIGIMADL